MKKFLSVFECKTANLYDYVAEINPDGLHVDVADGRAVKNLGLPLWLVPHLPKIPVHVHLMVKPTEMFVDMALSVAPEIIFIHPEWCEDAQFVVRAIEKGGAKAGIVWDCSDESQTYFDFNLASTILCMTVAPGKSGQSFMHERLDAIQEFARTKDVWIDGGVNSRVLESLSDSFRDLPIQGVVIGSAAREVFLGEASESIRVPTSEHVSTNSPLTSHD